MKTERELRLYIRKLISENISNFVNPTDEPEVIQLEDETQATFIGDPISNVEMNQMANELGSDGQNAPTVAVAPGSKKTGDDFTAGQNQAKFHDKTEMA